MNQLKSKERYYAVRVSKGPFCPDDLFRDIWDKTKELHKSHENFVTDFKDCFELGKFSDDSTLLTPEFVLNCIKGNVDGITHHRHLASLLNYEVVWYDDN